MLGALFETHVLGQIVRHFANQGRRGESYFYPDHHGREIDFLFPTAGRFELIECKWAESPVSAHRGFSQLESLVGPDRIISQTIVTPERGSRRASDRVTIDCAGRMIWLMLTIETNGGANEAARRASIGMVTEQAAGLGAAA